MYRSLDVVSSRSARLLGANRSVAEVSLQTVGADFERVQLDSITWSISYCANLVCFVQFGYVQTCCIACHPPGW